MKSGYLRVVTSQSVQLLSSRIRSMICQNETFLLAKSGRYPEYLTGSSCLICSMVNLELKTTELKLAESERKLSTSNIKKLSVVLIILWDDLILPPLLLRRSRQG